MRVRVQKWGKSLALRIPPDFARELHLSGDAEVDLLLKDGALAMIPVVAPAPGLAELLAGITSENCHGEVDTGPAVGMEVA